MGPSNTGKFTHKDYTVGWICALGIELAASTAMFDNIHAPLQYHPNDNNTYTLGSIGSHNIVAACLPSGEYGNSSATRVATQMQGSFESIKFGLMVGIGGGIPSEENDIRLGDVVVSKRTKKFSGVLQFDFGKTVAGGKFEHTSSLNKPPPRLLTMLSKLEAVHERGGNRISEHLSAMVKNNPRMEPKYIYQGQEHDVLFEAEYEHASSGYTCKNCESGRQISRPARDGNGPFIHYGLIASGNQVMKHAITRDKLRKELDGILCFEMEAAGLMDHFPCLVIRGICDYADSHKNKRWQCYAAATAAAYAKELLSVTEDESVLDTYALSMIATEDTDRDNGRETIEEKMTTQKIHTSELERNPDRKETMCLLQSTNHVDGPSFYLTEASMLTAKTGQTSREELPPESDIDIEAGTGDCQIAMLPARNGHKEVKHSVMGKEAGENARGGWATGNALYQAEHAAHDSSIRLLPKRGASDSAKIGHHGNGSRDDLELLLGNGDGIEQPLEDGVFELPLEDEMSVELSLENDSEIEIPLENGVDIELPLENGDEAEHPHGSEDKAEFPLENGDEAKLLPEKRDGVGLPYEASDIDRTSTDTSPGHQLSPKLGAASSGSHTFKPPLKKNIEVDEVLAYQLSFGLRADLDYGADHIVEQLLNEADIDTELRNQINCVLEPVSDRRHDHVVEDLLKIGADAYKSRHQPGPSIQPSPALQTASDHSTDHMVELLLKKEADIDPELRNQINYVLGPASDWNYD